MSDKRGDRLRLVIGGAGAIAVGYGVQLGISFLTKLAVARFAGQEAYGAIVTGAAVLTVLGAVATLGIDTGMSRFLPRFDDRERRQNFVATGFALVVPVAGLVGLGVYAAAAPAAELLFDSETMIGVLQAFGVAIPASVLLTFTVGVIRGEQRSLPRVLLENILFPVSRGVGIGIALVMGAGAIGLSWAYAAAYVLTALACLVYLAFKTPFQIARPDISAGRKLVWFSSPLLLSTLMSIVFSDIDTVLIGYLGHVADVGVYNAAYALATLLTVALNAVGFLLMPVLSEQDSMGDSEGIIFMSQTITKWLVLLTLPLVGLYLLIPGTIISLSFGDPYLDARSALAILSVGFFVHVAAGPAGNVLVSTGRSRYVLWATTAAAIANVLLNLLLIPRISILGAAIATTISYVLLNGIYIMKMYRMTGAVPFDGTTFTLIPIAGVLTAVGGMVLPTEGPVKIFILAMLAVGYAFAAYRIVELSDSEQKLLSEAAERLKVGLGGI